MNHPFRITVLTIAILATFVVHAREEETDLGAVVVTATRQPTRINEQLADVTVIEKEAIEKAGATTLPELLSRCPKFGVDLFRPLEEREDDHVPLGIRDRVILIGGDATGGIDPEPHGCLGRDPAGL